MGQVNVISTLLNRKKNRPISGRLRNHSDQSEERLQNFEIIFLLISKESNNFFPFSKIITCSESLLLNHELLYVIIFIGIIDKFNAQLLIMVEIYNEKLNHII